MGRLPGIAPLHWGQGRPSSGPALRRWGDISVILKQLEKEAAAQALDAAASEEELP